MNVTYAFSFHFLFPHLSSTGIERVAKHTVYMSTYRRLSQKRLKKYEAIHFICTTLEEKNARLLIVPFDMYASDASYED
jgi:hypothetical protein